jgi:hypothetical protein
VPSRARGAVLASLSLVLPSPPPMPAAAVAWGELVFSAAPAPLVPAPPSAAGYRAETTAPPP